MVKPLSRPVPPSESRQPASRRWSGWLRALGVVALCTALSEVIAPHMDLANIIMVYLAGVVYVALHEGTRVSVGTVVASILLFDLLFVPPRWGLNPLHAGHFVTFAVMLVVGLLISRLAARARAEAAAAADARIAAEAERLRNTVLSGISHDFRTPLTTIVGAATSLLAQDGRLDARMRESLAADILEEAQRLHGLITGLLDLARMEEGAVRLSGEWCPADDLVEEALAPLRARTAAHELHLEIPADAVVWCDPRLLAQALRNMVDNALRYTPAGSRIAVTVGLQPAQWTLSVADNGPGIPAGQEQDIFRKFQRGRAEPAGTGFGLGLAICAAVARLHGGSIVAANSAGARFTMVLPQPPRCAAPEAP